MGDELKPVPHWMEELSQSQMGEREEWAHAASANAKSCLAAEARERALREALALSREQHEVCGHDDRCDYCREAREMADAALAQPADDSALRTLVTRACEMQRTATARYLARADVTWDALWEMERETEKAPLVVDDALGKAGE